MSDLGSQLRAARQAKDLSLEQVFKATRIKIAYLEALESNRTDALPGLVQARGFVRTYANYLGLDGEALASSLDSGNLIMALPTPPAMPTSIEPAKPIGSAIRSTPIEPTAAKPIAATSTPTVAKPDRSSAPAQSTAKLRVPTLSSISMTRPAASTGGIPTPLLIVGAVVLFLIGALLIVTALSSGPKPALPPESSALNGTLVINSAADPTRSIALNAGPLSLTLTASEHVWVRVTADGQTTFEGMLAPNATQSWTAQDQIIVETGNAAALTVTRDGQTSVLGDRGQVVARAWGHGTVEDVPITLPDHSADVPAQPTTIATTTIKP
jgi:transcriptional regulator with XRE-family HTH domain